METKVDLRNEGDLQPEADQYGPWSVLDGTYDIRINPPEPSEISRINRDSSNLPEVLIPRARAVYLAEYLMRLVAPDYFESDEIQRKILRAIATAAKEVDGKDFSNFDRKQDRESTTQLGLEETPVFRALETVTSRALSKGKTTTLTREILTHLAAKQYEK